MKALLTAIQTALRGAAGLAYVRNSDIYITPHINYIPHGVKMPCIGIKDGAISRQFGDMTGHYDETLNVEIVVYVDLKKDEASIMGDAAAGRKGVLDLVDAVQIVLDDNDLSQSGVYAALMRQVSASEMFGDGRNGVQRQTMQFSYQRLT